MTESKIQKLTKISIQEINLSNAKNILKLLNNLENKGLEELTTKLGKAIQYADFWNFWRVCKHLDYQVADFHLTGISNVGYHTYCKHKENKTPYDLESKKVVMEHERVGEDVIGVCSRKNCPIYQNQ